MTTETALVWADTGLDRHDAFVAMSRARGDTRVFVDRASLETQLRLDRPLDDRTRASDLAERRALLARGMSRSGEKASTLDLAVYPDPIPELGQSTPITTNPGVVAADPAAAPTTPQTTRKTRDRRRSREAGREA